jgi:hypothetical protein
MQSVTGRAAESEIRDWATGGQHEKMRSGHQWPSRKMRLLGVERGSLQKPDTSC